MQTNRPLMILVSYLHLCCNFQSSGEVLFNFYFFSVFQLMVPTRRFLYLARVMQLLDFGIHALQVERYEHIMAMKEMLTLLSSFQTVRDLVQDQMMVHVDYLTWGLATSSKFTSMSRVIMMPQLWPPLHSQYQAGFFLLDTQMAIAMCGTPYWPRYFFSSFLPWLLVKIIVHKTKGTSRTFETSPMYVIKRHITTTIQHSLTQVFADAW